jgi:hypothetical protein
LPVDELDNVDWKEGVQLTSGGGSMSVIKGGPNPNATKVFINWFLSRRGPTRVTKIQRPLRRGCAEFPAYRYSKGYARAGHAIKNRNEIF